MSRNKSISKVYKKKVNLLFDHLVFHTKYNRPVLIGHKQSMTEMVIREVLDDLGCETVEVNIQPNHVHILFEFPTSLPLAKVAQKVKSITSKVLRETFPELKRELPKALWAPSCCHTTVGAEKHDVIRYIRDQDKHLTDKESKQKRWRRRWQS